VRDIRRAAVVGAGTMGTGIAMTFANAGIPVLLNDVSEPALERGMTAIRRNYAAAVQKGRISPELMERTLARITPQASFENFEIADIVVEAAYENLKVKKQVFAAISNTTKPECLLATNTSSLDIDAIAAATVRPASVVGLHFFSPANVMRLVEVVRGTATTDDTIAATMNVAKRLGKIAVLSRNAFGFIGNRLVIPYVREAHFLLEEGASVEQVNRALFDFGMRMGPLTMEDLIGLDVMQAIREESRVRQNLRTRQPLAPDLLYQAGLFGQKSGSGWSQYDEKRHASPNPASAQLIAQAAEKAGTRRRQISNEEIVQRCVYALINEGAKVLEEKIALRAVDIDIVYVYGYGFPAWRGGPMFYAQTIGPGTVLNAIEGFAKEFGEDLWQPSERLREMAR
jgi:3-hydroxyacyl-CoA dehydrogenase